MVNKFILFCLCLILFTSCYSDYYNRRIELVELAYFEGQRDALEGDIRIKKNIDGCYVWSKSPWDGGSWPIFNPSIICE